MVARCPDVDLADASAAFDRVRSTILAVDATRLSRLNTDVGAAVARALAASRALTEYRERIVALAEFDISHVDRLADYAKAVWYLHTIHAELTTDCPRVLVEEMLALRGALLMWAGPLTASGLFPNGSLKGLGDGRSHRGAARDLARLADLYRRHWAEVRDNCGVGEEELNRATQLCAQAEAALSCRSRSDAELLRAKAWTLLECVFRPT